MSRRCVSECESTHVGNFSGGYFGLRRFGPEISTMAITINCGFGCVCMHKCISKV